MKKIHFPILLATALCLTACSNDDDVNNNQSYIGDNKIELGSASNSNVTRAGFTEGQTRLMLHFVSDKAYSNDDAQTETSTRYMATVATAAVDNEKSETSVSNVVYGTTGTEEVAYARYWDDIHGKNSALSIYGIAVPNTASISNENNKKYFDVSGSEAANSWNTLRFEGKTATTTAVSHEVVWNISTTQTTETFKDEDLTYTNNDANPNNAEAGTGGDNRLKWTGNAFDKAVGDKAMEFKHALSRLTLQIKHDGSFTEELFNITNVKLQNFYNSGTLNVQTGVYTGSTTEAMEIVGLTTTIADGYKNAYTALVGSTTSIKEDDPTTMITLVIDNNSYNISAKEIANAIKVAKKDFEKLEQGVNYVLMITVAKKKIESIEARLVGWTDVKGDLGNLSNARITITSEMESETGNTENVVAYDLYRSPYTYTPADNTNTDDIDAVENYDYKTGYSEHIAMAKDATTTSWIWPNNLTFYHFRSISPQNAPVTTDAASGDHITLSSGQQTDANDYIWGAPLKKKTEEGYVYNYGQLTGKKDGYGEYVFKAIGPTNDKINITQFHVMSNVIVNLTTPNTDGTLADNGVDLTDAKIYIVRFSENGTMRLGDAYITPSNETKDKAEMGIVSEKNTSVSTQHTYRIVPQSLTRGENVTDKIGLLIVTKDNNTYKVDDLSTIVQSGTATVIDRWLPGYTYEYTFNLTKTKIQSIEARLVDWVTITGTLGSDITLEN